jgi:uncharacterized membrane protein
MTDKRHSNYADHADEVVRKRVSNRIIGFSDGVFAISITLLVLTINVPSNLTSSEEVSAFLRQALPQLVVYAVAFMVIGTFWLRHHRMLMLCRAVDGRMLVLNLVFLAFVSLLPFPTDLLGNVQSTSTVIAFCAVAGAATLCEIGLWRHLHRHRELLVPDISQERVRSLTMWRLGALGVFIIPLVVSLFFPGIAVLLVLALLPLYEMVHHRRFLRHIHTLYLLRED